MIYSFIGFPNKNKHTFLNPVSTLNTDEVALSPEFFADTLLLCNKNFEYVVYCDEHDHKATRLRSRLTGSGRKMTSLGHVIIDGIHDFENCPVCNKQP